MELIWAILTPEWSLASKLRHSANYRKQVSPWNVFRKQENGSRESWNSLNEKTKKNTLLCKRRNTKKEKKIQNDSNGDIFRDLDSEFASGHVNMSIYGEENLTEFPLTLNCTYAFVFIIMRCVTKKSIIVLHNSTQKLTEIHSRDFRLVIWQ